MTRARTASATLEGVIATLKTSKAISINTVSRNAATSDLNTPLPGITICRLSRITTATFPTRVSNLLANMQCRQQSN